MDPELGSTLEPLMISRIMHHRDLDHLSSWWMDATRTWSRSRMSARSSPRIYPFPERDRRFAKVEVESIAREKVIIFI